MENSKFLNLLDPVFRYVDTGAFFRQPFKWLYVIIGVLNIIIPIALIVTISDVWSYMDGGMRFASVLQVLIGIAVAYVGFLIWFKRGQQLKCDAGEKSRFIAIPLVANLVQTLGEWYGMLVGVGAFLMMLIALLFGGRLMWGNVNPWIVLLMPVLGYVIVVFFRFLAESFLALANIANSAQSINSKLEPKDEAASCVAPEATDEAIDEVDIYVEK